MKYEEKLRDRDQKKHKTKSIEWMYWDSKPQQNDHTI